MKIKTLMITGAVVLCSAGSAFAASQTITRVSSDGSRSTTHYYAADTDAYPAEDDYYVDDKAAMDDADVEDRSATQWYPVPVENMGQRTHIVYGVPVYQGPVTERTHVVYTTPDDQDDTVITATDSYVVIDKNREATMEQQDWDNRRMDGRQ